VRQPAVATARAAGLDGRRARVEADDAHSPVRRHFPWTGKSAFDPTSLPVYLRSPNRTDRRRRKDAANLYIPVSTYQYSRGGSNEMTGLAPLL
jgi:hypothetical protein